MAVSPFTRRLRIGDMALPEGAEVGLIGGLAVVVVFLARDLTAGHWLHTPSVLGTLLFYGPEAAREVVSAPGIAAVYNLIHFALWMVVGVVAVAAVKRAEVDPRMRFVPWAALAGIVVVFIVLDVWVRETGLGRTHLWSGGLIAATTVAALLAWRHPDAVAPSEELEGDDASSE